MHASLPQNAARLQQHHAQMFPTASLEFKENVQRQPFGHAMAQSHIRSRAHAWSGTGRLQRCSSQLEELQLLSYMVTDILHAPNKPYSSNELCLIACVEELDATVCK